MTNLWLQVANRFKSAMEAIGIRAIDLEGHDFTFELQGVPRPLFHHFRGGKLTWSVDAIENVQGKHAYHAYRLADEVVLLDFRKNANGIAERNLFFLNFSEAAGLLACIRRRPKSGRLSLSLRRASLGRPFSITALTVFPTSSALSGRTLEVAANPGSSFYFGPDGRLSLTAKMEADKIYAAPADYLAFKCTDSIQIATFRAREGQAAGALFCCWHNGTARAFLDTVDDK